MVASAADGVEMIQINIALDADEFQQLINGKEIIIGGRLADVQVHMILKDIGFSRMLQLIKEAMSSRDEN